MTPKKTTKKKVTKKKATKKKVTKKKTTKKKVTKKKTTKKKVTKKKATKKKVTKKKATKKKVTKKKPEVFRTFTPKQKVITPQAPKDPVSEKIIARIKKVFHPIQLSISNNTSAHKHHSQAKEHGGGHYKITVVSELFIGLSIFQRQKWMHKTLEDMYKKEIHAIELNLRDPSEAGYKFR